MIDDRTRRLVIAARKMAFGGFFDGCDVEQKDALRELDDASEAFAAEVPWDDAPAEAQ